jgi:hypothetical protein
MMPFHVTALGATEADTGDGLGAAAATNAAIVISAIKTHPFVREK